MQAKLAREKDSIPRQLQLLFARLQLREQKAVKTAAETFRPNPDLDVMKTITMLGVGEALVRGLVEGKPACSVELRASDPIVQQGPQRPV